MPPLWEFMLEKYAQEGMKEACLELQNTQSMDVLLVLTDLYLEQLWPPQSALEPYLRWREDFILPLRALRQKLERQDALRSEFLRLELKAEERGVKLLEEALAGVSSRQRLELGRQNFAFNDGFFREQALAPWQRFLAVWL